MQREKTKFRHILPDKSVIRVTKEDGKFYIGDTNERAEGKMVHTNNILYAGNGQRKKAVKFHSKKAKNTPIPGDEWSDYAHSANDL